jgi:two-component system response regulator
MTEPAEGGADTASGGRGGDRLNPAGFPVTHGLPAAAGLPPGPQPVEVLLVEDDAGDELMTREAFEDNRIGNRLHVVRDGRQALDFLYRLGDHADAPRPGLVLLDLNLPRVDGRQVLEKIKADPNLADIPVVVLTTSSAEEDILRSYNLHANAYVTKPVDLDRFVAAIRTIDDFFVTVVKLPRRA